MKFLLKIVLGGVVAALCLIVFLVGVHHATVRKYNQPEGINSYTDQYKLVPLTSKKDLLCTAMVVDAHMGYEVLYSLPRCFSSNWTFYSCWAIDRNDFFACSHETGAYLYKYDADTKSWSEYRLAKAAGDVEKYVIYSTEGHRSETEEYSVEAIPDNVFGFIRSW